MLRRPLNDASVIFKPCVIVSCNVTNQLRNIFPIWALGLYRRLVLLGHTRLPSSEPAAAAGATANGSSSSSKKGAAAAAAGGAVAAPGVGWLCAVSDFVSTKPQAAA
jgi:hypothetical protein